MSKVCKVCAQTVIFEYFHLTGSSFVLNNTKIKDLLQSCFPEVSATFMDDDVICKNCMSALHIVHSFRNTILNNKALVETVMDFKIKTESINNVCDDSARCVHEDTSNNLYQCSKCNFTTNTNSSLEMHNRIHTGEKPFHCTMCPYEAKRKSHLQEHFTKHTNLRPFQCTFCKKCFTTKQIRRKHQLIHTGEKPYICSQCDFRARYKETLSNHVLKVHVGVQKLTDSGKICYICGKRLSGQSALKVHMRIHTGVKSHLCELCGKYFREQGMLKTHLLLHTGTKPFKCIQCDYTGARKAHLQQHMHTHRSNLDLFKCKTCDKCYTNKLLLRKHTKTHSV